ncbi:MAG: hypothetical protein ACI87E_005288 [Mariniblastus sp.]
MGRKCLPAINRIEIGLSEQAGSFWEALIRHAWALGSWSVFEVHPNLPERGLRSTGMHGNLGWGLPAQLIADGRIRPRIAQLLQRFKVSLGYFGRHRDL